MRADLHIHSRYSDGGLWPSEIASLVSEAGVEAACVADHDTLGGYAEFAEAASGLGLSTWPAVEIDCVDSETAYKSEILAYFPEGRYAGTEAFLSVGRADRAAKIAALCERARALFGPRMPDFGAIVGGRSAGRPLGLPGLEPGALRFSKTDLYIALRDSGSIPRAGSYKEFKKAYFDTGLFSDLRFEKPELADVARLVSGDGGLLVAPHVGHEFGDSLRSMATAEGRLGRLLERFRELGVRGVELYDYRTRDGAAMNALVAEKSAALGFFHTYGSDYHGPGSAKDGLGSFYGDFKGFPA